MSTSEPPLLSPMSESRDRPEISSLRGLSDRRSAAPTRIVRMAWPRAPAVPIVAVFAAGIATDRCSGPDIRWWLAIGLAGLAAWIGFYRRGRFVVSVVALLIGVAAIGGGWHHWRWSVIAQDDISCFAGEQPRLVHVTGKIITPLDIYQRQSSPWNGAGHDDRSSACVMECRQFTASSGRIIPVTGRVRLFISGILAAAEPGAEIELTGHLSRPLGPRYDGEYDRAEALRREEIRAVLSCSQPEGVRIRVEETSVVFRWARDLRIRLESLLQNSLSPRTAPVGVALLLGTRSGLTEDVRRDFAESGTTHILAISGINVAILAGVIWAFCRLLFQMRTLWTSIWVLTGILVYACVADTNPPVLRAVVMIVVCYAGLPWYRAASAMNALALAAGFALAWNPTHLFDVGAQLSFLAVLALIWGDSLRQSWRRTEEGPIDALVRRTRPWWHRASIWSGKQLLLGLASTVVIWAFTLPLTLARFQVISPVSLLANVMLIPLSFILMWSGYLLLIFGGIWAPLGVPFAVMFDWSLTGLLNLANWSANLRGGHFYVHGPEDWWLVGFYGLLTAGVAAQALGVATWRRWSWRALGIWTIIGLAFPLLPRSSEGLVCRFLPVGHGVAVLMEFPNGRTLLYDAGQIQNALHAERAVRQALWQTRRQRIDALVISHADVDHFNAVPGLLRTVPVDHVFLHRTFLDFDQPLVKRVCDELEAQQTPVRLLWAADKIRIDEQVELTILQPPVGGHRGSDNANSLVLEVVYAGRRILLTGDLEGPGLHELLRQPARPVDVMLSPHHGSQKANTVALANWASPRWVIVSGGRRDGGDKLRRIYGPQSKLLSTYDYGTVTCRIDPRGGTRMTAFSAPRWTPLADH